MRDVIIRSTKQEITSDINYIQSCLSIFSYEKIIDKSKLIIKNVLLREVIVAI